MQSLPQSQSMAPKISVLWMRVAEVPRTGKETSWGFGWSTENESNRQRSGFALRTAGLCCEEEGLRFAL